MKSVVLTGVKPTSQPHIGNYLGAIAPALDLAGKAEKSYLFIADGHALVGTHKAGEMKQMVSEVVAAWLACGLEPKKTIIYKQSDIPEIFELSWILSCFTPKGFMNRAHAYKALVSENQSRKVKDLDHGVSMGLYTYPILMAADILLFSANKVPVGVDQKQHVEFARDIALKVTQAFEKSVKALKEKSFKAAKGLEESLVSPLVLPEPVISESTGVIPGIDGRKMSKSYGNHIPMFCEEKKLFKLVRKIKTDSTPPDEPKSPKNSIIMDLYKLFASKEETANFIDNYKKGISWGEAKDKLAGLLNDCFKEKRAIFESYINDPKKLERILQDGAMDARLVAKKNLETIKKGFGLL